MSKTLRESENRIQKDGKIHNTVSKNGKNICLQMVHFAGPVGSPGGQLKRRSAPD